MNVIIKKNIFYICKGFLGSEISWKPSCGTSVNEYPRKREKRPLIMANEVPVKIKRRDSIGFDVNFLATPLGLIRVFQIVSAVVIKDKVVSKFFQVEFPSVVLKNS